MWLPEQDVDWGAVCRAEEWVEFEESVMSVKAGLPTQKDRLLAALRDAGSRGVVATEFAAPNVLDGGKPVMRVAARVHELRQDGHVIRERREANGVARYVLVADADAGAQTSLAVAA